MNLVKKFPALTLVEYSTKGIDTSQANRSKEPEIALGAKPIAQIKVGEYVVGTNKTFSKVIAINITEGTTKTVTLSNNNSFSIDSASTIEVGEIVSENSILNPTVTSVTEGTSEKLFELILEGTGELTVNNVEL